jgi:hypothetical protein
MRYCPIRKLLAVGGQRGGLVKVYTLIVGTFSPHRFGGPSIEIRLQSTSEVGTGRVSFLEFLAQGLIVVYENIIELWDLDKRVIKQAWPFDHRYSTLPDCAKEKLLQLFTRF